MGSNTLDILVLDDQEWTAEKLIATLRNRGAHVDYASTLDDALTLLQDNQYHGIVTDFHIDELDGKIFLRLVKGKFGEYCEIDANDPGTDIDDVSGYDKDTGKKIKETFEEFDQYRKFVARHKGTQYVLFSAHPFGDCIQEPIIDDVFVEQKNNMNLSDYTAEKAIAEHLGLKEQRSAAEQESIEEKALLEEF